MGSKRDKRSGDGGGRKKGSKRPRSAQDGTNPAQSEGNFARDTVARDAGPPGPRHGGGQYSGGRPHIQLVSDDMQHYVRELATNLSNGDISEDHVEILVSNALEEFVGKEAQLCKDPVCSRAVEELVDLFTTAQLIEFIGSLSQGDDERITGVYIDPFASHVVERLFARIRSILKESPQDVSADLIGALEQLCKCLKSERLFNIATHKYGSHVMRSLFVLLSGVEYPTTRSNKGWNKIFSFSIERAQTYAKYRTNKKLVHLKDKLAKRYLKLHRDDLTRMACDQYGSPVLQTFLQCTIGEEFGSRLIFKLLRGPKASEADSGSSKGEKKTLCASSFKRLAQHNLASHLMESVFISAEEKLRQDLYEECLRGKIEEFVFHPFANFVIQALVTCVTNKNVAKSLVEELLPFFERMLRSSKGGGVAAALNMCSRLNVKTAKAVRVLESMAAKAVEAKGGEGEGSDLVMALLSIDRNPRQGQGYQVHVSKVGGTIVTAILKFPQEKCGSVTKSISSLSADQITQMANDYVGVRVLEAFLESEAASSEKQAFIGRLRGHFASFSRDRYKSFFVEKCLRQVSDGDAALRAEIASACDGAGGRRPRGGGTGDPGSGWHRGEN